MLIVPLLFFAVAVTLALLTAAIVVSLIKFL